MAKGKLGAPSAEPPFLTLNLPTQHSPARASAGPAPAVRHQHKHPVRDKGRLRPSHHFNNRSGALGCPSGSCSVLKGNKNHRAGLEIVLQETTTTKGWRGGGSLCPTTHPPLTPSFSFPHGKGSFVLPTDHKPKQETTGFLQQKGRSLSADGNDSANGAELPFQRLKQH